MTDRLLAKSYDRTRHPNEPPSYSLLVQHSRDVAAACDALAHAAGRVTLYNADLDEESFSDFQTALRADGWLQDIGKASSHFQEMVRNPAGPSKQLLRHETLSGLLLWLDDSPLKRWFAALPLSTPFRLAALWGAIGHHRKFHSDTKPEHCNRLSVLVTHDDFRMILAEMSASLNVESPCEFGRDTVFVYSGREAGVSGDGVGAYEAVRDLRDEFDDLKSEVTDASARRIVALIKAFGIAADVAASAVAKHEYKTGGARTDYVTRFVSEKMSVGLTPQEIGELVSKRLGGSPTGQLCSPQDGAAHILEETKNVRAAFQGRVAAAARGGAFLTLARAGCGSGKSIAAYRWAREWCERFDREGRKNFRLFFCLPTTGTTTEHYKDYALESGIEDAALVHSRRDVDLLEIAQTAPQEGASGDDDDPAKAAQRALAEMRDRLESLELWSTPLVVSTTDTVLGLMANARRAVYSFPAIMSGAIVFDEIHAYDDHLFGHLLVFLKNFPRLPVLLMTASLPEERLRLIRHARPDLKDEQVIEGPREFEELPRYVVHDAATDEQIWRAVEECVRGRERGKVLWVCNRVERANETYLACRTEFREAAVDVYHSRFLYKDRSRRHGRVIKAFKDNQCAAILVATQVAEMSLDLSADLLVTDVAPATALIQRMGRLNRRALPSDPEDERPPKPALIRPLLPDEAKNPLPYAEEEIEAARLWLKRLAARGPALSQRDLAEALAALEKKESISPEKFLKRAERKAIFFSGLWETRPGETRLDGHTVTILREEDVKKCDDFDRKGNPSRQWIRKHEVAINFRPDVMRWTPVGGRPCAPAGVITYDFDENEDGTGAEWKKRK